MISRPPGRNVPTQRTTVTIANGPLVGPILRRVVAMLAARADLPVDRLDDAVLVADTISARTGRHVVQERLEVTVETAQRSLVLRFGPLGTGGGQGLLDDAAVPGLGNVVERLADDLAIETDGTAGSEFVVVTLAFHD
jgi:hypothetical protein